MTDQVAASGGYMMACVADEIIASPFAVLGSIGVLTEVPNVYERLKREGVEFSTVTAGAYKRSLTPMRPVWQVVLLHAAPPGSQHEATLRHAATQAHSCPSPGRRPPAVGRQPHQQRRGPLCTGP